MRSRNSFIVLSLSFPSRIVSYATWSISIRIKCMFWGFGFSEVSSTEMQEEFFDFPNELKEGLMIVGVEAGMESCICNFQFEADKPDIY